VFITRRMTDITALKALQELVQKYPERFEEVVKEHPEWWEIVREEGREAELTALCRVDSPEGFCAFYEGLHGIKPPWQVVLWVKEIYEAHEQGLGYTLNGFRGSWKSTSLSVDFVAWRIAKEPQKTNLIVCANDDSANKITKSIAQVIEWHPFWKKAFPDVVPVEGRWSEHGYWVRDASIPMEEWAREQAGVIDPTFLGGGYTSTRINGKHPTGVLAIDDIHDLNNSASEIERKFVVKFVTTVLMKTVIYVNDKLDTWVLNIGVPWADDDTHQVLARSGAFKSHVLPVMTRAEEGEGDYIDGVNEVTGAVYEDIVGWWKLAWKEKFGVKSIKQIRGASKADFHQMMMMDMHAARAGGLRYYVYPHQEIDKTMPCVTGVDPSYTFRERREYDAKSSCFAAANVVKRIQGGLVLEGGVLEQCTTQEAAGQLRAIKSRFANHLFFAVENAGIGRLFKQILELIAPELVLIDSDLRMERSGKTKNKWDRIKTELAPFLESAVVLVSDEDTEFLKAVRDGLDRFHELEPQKADKRWDALDAFYHAVKSMPDVVRQDVVKKESVSPFAGRLALRNKR